MKKKYDVIHAKIFSELNGTYKNLDETHHSMLTLHNSYSNNTDTYIVSGTKNNKFGNLEQKRSSKIGEASPTEWQYQSFKRLSSASITSTFSHQTITITPITEHQKPVMQEQRMSLVQELSLALAKGENEFVKVISLSQAQKEGLRKEQTQVKSKNFLKQLSKFFTRSQKEITNQEFKFENKDVYTYK